MMYNVKTNSEKAEASPKKMDDLPKISDAKQDVTQGYLAEIYQAIERNENVEPIDDKEQPRLSCILPRTTIEFE